MTDQGFADTFFRHACERKKALHIALAFVLFMFPLMFISLTLVEKGSATYVVTILNLAGLVFFGLLFGGLLGVCRVRAKNRSWR